MHHAYLDVLSMGNLLPFAGGLFCSFVPRWTAFPSSDYYGSSVTIGLSPRRQSRALLTSYGSMGEVAFSFREEDSLPPVLPSKVRVSIELGFRDLELVARKGSVGIRRFPTGLCGTNLELGFRQ